MLTEGLLRLVEGADPVAVRDRLRAALPEDVLVLTRADFVARETAYWNRATPIGASDPAKMAVT